MAIRNNQDIIASERELSLEKVVQAGLPILKNENDRTVAAAITVVMGRFMNVCFPNQPKEELIMEFAEEVIRNRFTWNFTDISMFFKFIKERQDIPELKIMGNTLTYLKLMEMVAVYEDHRAQAIEDAHNKRKGDAMISGDNTRKSLDELDQARMKGEIERAKGTWKNYPKVNHQKFFEK